MIHNTTCFLSRERFSADATGSLSSELPTNTLKMDISELIEMLETHLEQDGDMEIFIYDSHGDKLEPKCLQVGSILRGRGIEDFAYISDLE